MRIAFVLGDFPALSETFVLDQITGLLDRGHDVEIFAEKARREGESHPDVERYDLLSHTRYERMPGVAARFFYAPRVMVSGGLRTLDLRRYGRLAASLRLLFAAEPFLDRGAYDVIHCHFVANAIKAALLRDARVIRGALVSTFHGPDVALHLGLYGASARRLLFESGELFLPVSDRWTDRLMALGCSRERIVTHRMGVDPSFFSAEPRGRGRRIVTVGRLVEKKGLEYGIRAVVHLAAEGLPVEYVVVGDGPLKGRLRRLVRELDAEDVVRLIGAKPRPVVAAELCAADIFLSPSVTARNGDSEGVPVAVMEAMASGLPVVASRHAGIPELVLDGETGFLVPERDVEGLAARLRLLLQQRQLARRLGDRGRRRISEEFDIERLNDRLVELYERAIAQGRAE